jgi:hypothetical protein
LGEPRPIEERILSLSVSEEGALAYLPMNIPPVQLAWVDRTGKLVGKVGQPGTYAGVSLSRDGSRAAVVRWDVDNLGESDLWLVDLRRDVTSRFTALPGEETYPVWSRGRPSPCWYHPP